MSLGISYKISAIDDISRNVKKISRNVDKMDNKIKGISKTSKKASRNFISSFKGMSRSAGSLSGKLKGLAIAGAAFFGLKNVFSKGMEFEDSMAAVATVTGAAGKDLEFFSSESIRMSKRFGTSASSIANSFLAIGSAKSELLKSPKELAKIVEQTILLSKAGGISVDIATDAMTKSLNIFKKGADQSQRFSDIMIQGTVVGASLMHQFSESMLNAGGASSAAGLDFAETTALIQLLSKGGEVGARAGTALNAFLAKMSKDFKDVDISSGEKIVTFLDKLSVAESKGFNISAKFGEEAARAVRILIKQREFLPSFLKDIRSAGGATKKAAATMMDTTSNRLAQLRSSLDEAMLKLFVKLEPLLSKMVTRFTNWINSLDSSDVEGFMVMLDGIIASLQALLETLAGVASAFGYVGTGLGKTAGAIATGDISGFDKERAENAEWIKSSGGTVGFISSISQDLADLIGGDNGTKTTIDLNINDQKGVIQSVTQKTEPLKGSGKRKSKVKTNMSGM